MEATSPAGSNFLPQQAKFDVFVQEFNNGELSYPFRDRTALVTCCGRICIYKKINLSTSLAGQAVGIKEVDDGIWLVSL